MYTVSITKVFINIFTTLVVWAGGTMWFYDLADNANMPVAICFWLFMSAVMSGTALRENIYKGLKKHSRTGL